MRFENDTENWRQNLLSELSTSTGGGTPSTKIKEYWKGNIGWISSSDLQDDNVSQISVTRFISNDAIINSSTKICPPNTIHIVSRVGVGKVAISKESLCTSQDFVNLIDYKLKPLFLTYQLQCKIKEMIKSTQGTSIKGLTTKEINLIKLSYPNKDIQEKIANFLSLIDQLIDTQSKIIEKYESLISTIRMNIFSSFQGKWTKLCDLVENKSLQLNRGNIIPKHPKDDVYKYPVYSSSVQKDGLMGYSDYYMFDKELITWSIDGGGDIFFREKHKFCVTNVCGILQLDTNKFSYRFVAEALKYQHSKMTFDYQTKAHPSVIEKLYALPEIELNEQNKYSKLFEVLYSKLGNERKYLEIIKEQKKYLLSNMFI